MFTILLTLHITTLIVSIIATTVMVLLALASKFAPKFMRLTNLAITLVGISVGIVMLIHNPLGSRCIELTTYVVVFAVAYRFIEARQTSTASITARA